MTTKNLSNEFMAKVLEEKAWVELSSELAWTEQLLEQYKDRVDWKEVSANRYVVWTVPMIEKFKNRIDWDELSESDNEHLFTAELLEKYKNRWNWRELSCNSSLPLTEELLEQFADYWDWGRIINNYGGEKLFDVEFCEKFQGRIPASELQQSHLWYKMVEDEKKLLKIRIYS